MSNTVKVCVRVRPLSDTELQRGDGLGVYVANDTTVKLMTSSSSAVSSPVETSTFHFDQVFGPDTSQEEVFDRSDIQNCCEAALNGCGVTVFTSGHTTAGKTYTMSGPPSTNKIWNSDTGKISELFHRYLISTENNMSASAQVDPRYAEVFRSLGLQFRAGVHLLRRAQGIVQDEEKKIARLDERNMSTSETTKITIRAAMYEIYNETVNDLLNETTNLKVRMSSSGSNGFFVENLMMVEVSSMEDLFAILAQGESSRKRSSHSDSTRSHVIFSLAIERYQEIVNEVDGSVSYVPLVGKMNFVDLAGSERVGNSLAFKALTNNLSSASADKNSSAAVADEKKSAFPTIAEKFGPQNAQIQQHQTELLEARKINQSLLVLGKVISALSANSRTNNFANLQHIPFRDSTLTKLLIDSLTGQAVTLMIACVSPSSKFLDETKNTLQYATMARSISGYKHVNVGNASSRVDAGRGELHQLRKEVELLRRENFSMRKQLVASNEEKQRLKRQLEQVLNLNPDCRSTTTTTTTSAPSSVDRAGSTSTTTGTSSPNAPPVPVVSSQQQQLLQQTTARSDNHAQTSSSYSPDSRAPIDYYYSSSDGGEKKKEMMHYPNLFHGHQDTATTTNNAQSMASAASYDGELGRNDDNDEPQLQAKTSMLYVNNNVSQNLLVNQQQQQQQQQLQQQNENFDSNNNTSTNFGEGTQNSTSSSMMNETLRRVENDNASLKTEIEELKKLVMDISKRTAAVMKDDNNDYDDDDKKVKKEEEKPAQQKANRAGVEDSKNQEVEQQQQQQPVSSNSNDSRPFYGFVPTKQKKVVLTAKRSVVVEKQAPVEATESEQNSSGNNQNNTTNTNTSNTRPPSSNVNQGRSGGGSGAASSMSVSARALPLSLGDLAFDAVTGNV